MALTPDDIALHLRLIRSYEERAADAFRDFQLAEVRHQVAKTAIENEKALLRAEGVDI